jgi:hypothetical protein
MNAAFSARSILLASFLAPAFAPQEQDVYSPAYKNHLLRSVGARCEHSAPTELIEIS